MLKKYRALSILTIIIIVTFSLFYVQSHTLSQSFPQYKINTIEGDESFSDELLIKGDFYGPYADEEFEVTREGTNYLRDERLIKRLEGNHVPNKVQQLRNEQRKFMRMKSYDENEYFIVEDTIISVQIPYSRWGIYKGIIELETYNRTTKETNRYEIDAPDLLDYAMIEKMYMNDGILYIPILNMEYSMDTDGEKTKFHLYMFDLNEGKLIDSIETLIDSSDYYVAFANVFVDNEQQLTEMIITHAVISEEYYEDTTDEATSPEAIKLANIVKIDLKTKEITEIEIEKSNNDALPIAYNGSEILFVNIHSDILVFESYNVETKEKTEKLNVELDSQNISIWEFENKIIHDGKIYFLLDHDMEQRATVLIIDLLTTELLFKGAIEIEDYLPIQSGETEVYFHTLELRHDGK